MSSWLTSSAPGVMGANDIPPPRSDAARNTPPEDQHKRVIDFVREAPNAKYIFDSRINRENGEQIADLCRVRPDGGMSCIKLAMASASLFKSMQSLGFFCALPAEPTRTHMECNALPRS